MLRNSTPGGAQVLVEKGRKLGCWMGCLASGVSWHAEVLGRSWRPPLAMCCFLGGSRGTHLEGVMESKGHEVRKAYQWLTRRQGQLCVFYPGSGQLSQAILLSVKCWFLSGIGYLARVSMGDE